MAESWDNGLKTPLNGLLHKNFEFGPLFGCHNFQNQIDTWETTVERLNWPQTKMHTISATTFAQSFSCSLTWCELFCSEC